MKCNFRTMATVAAVMFGTAALAYLTFEGARTAILASLPLMAVLLCPLSLLAMMMFMRSSAKEERPAAPVLEQNPAEAGAADGRGRDAPQFQPVR